MTNFCSPRNHKTIVWNIFSNLFYFKRYSAASLKMTHPVCVYIYIYIYIYIIFIIIIIKSTYTYSIY